MIFMISEEQKFCAEVYKISAFALMTPFGRFFLFFSDLNLSDLTILFFTHLVISIVLFCYGVIMLQRAYEQVLGD